MIIIYQSVNHSQMSEINKDFFILIETEAESTSFKGTEELKLSLSIMMGHVYFPSQLTVPLNLTCLHNTIGDIFIFFFNDYFNRIQLVDQVSRCEYP